MCPRPPGQITIYNYQFFPRYPSQLKSFPLKLENPMFYDQIFFSILSFHTSTLVKRKQLNTFNNVPYFENEACQFDILFYLLLIINKPRITK
jgi:hypothetical protein